MRLARAALLVVLLSPAACDAPTMVVVDNDYPQVAEGGDPAAETTVYKVWWVASLLPDAVAPGREGTAERSVPGTDFAYAVLAPGWDPSFASPPTRFLPARSSAQLTADRGDTLHVRVSSGTFVGDCAAGEPLSQSDADFVTQRIFPDEFSGVTYDAAHCSTTSDATDASDESDRSADAPPSDPDAAAE